MDPSHRSSLEPPKDWAKKFYQRPPAGKHKSYFRFIYRNEAPIAWGVGALLIGAFWYSLLKPFFTGFGDYFRMSPAEFKDMWDKTWIPKTKEERELIRQRGGMNVRSINDLRDGTMGYRPKVTAPPQPALPSDEPV